MYCNISSFFQAIEEYKNSSKKCSTSKEKFQNAAKTSTLEEFDLTGAHMVNLLGYIEAFFSNAITQAFPEISQPTTVQIQVSKLADYQCNAAMALAKVR